MENSKAKMFNKSKGDRGEVVASAWLERHGFEILDMNYKGENGEMDISQPKIQSTNMFKKVAIEFFTLSRSKRGIVVANMGMGGKRLIYKNRNAFETRANFI